ncbi:hypothetical protein O3P69_015392 [Scylla paramamosain]|uniref:Uncharacterized protein n=1 Tax=Scylla paramamosain TaxID=85552 RepID=A0AAW0T4C9_SCYPA
MRVSVKKFMRSVKANWFTPPLSYLPRQDWAGREGSREGGWALLTLGGRGKMGECGHDVTNHSSGSAGTPPPVGQEAELTRLPPPGPRGAGGRWGTQILDMILVSDEVDDTEGLTKATQATLTKGDWSQTPHSPPESRVMCDGHEHASGATDGFSS